LQLMVDRCAVGCVDEWSAGRAQLLTSTLGPWTLVCGLWTLDFGPWTGTLDPSADARSVTVSPTPPLLDVGWGGCVGSCILGVLLSAICFRCSHSHSRHTEAVVATPNSSGCGRGDGLALATPVCSLQYGSRTSCAGLSLARDSPSEWQSWGTM
jgi:hypothetical protein